jgi:hypothetical protein
MKRIVAGGGPATTRSSWITPDWIPSLLRRHSSAAAVSRSASPPPSGACHCAGQGASTGGRALRFAEWSPSEVAAVASRPAGNDRRPAASMPPKVGDGISAQGMDRLGVVWTVEGGGS